MIVPASDHPTVEASPADTIPNGAVPGRVFQAAWPAMILATLILLPFLGKAHTMDDVTFLLQAQHVLHDPLHPTAFEMVSDGNRIRLSSRLVSGPVMSYLLVPSILLGGAEWAAHLVQFVLILAAILATVSLAFRLGLGRQEARLTGLLLAATPAVMAMATTSMADVPAMAFGVLGMERLLCWKEKGRWHSFLAASLGFTLAALSRPHLLFILPVAALAMLSSRNSLGRWRVIWRPRPVCLPLLAALAMILALSRVTADPNRASSDFLSVALSRFQVAYFPAHLAAFFIHWVLVLPLALPWVWMRVRWGKILRSPVSWSALAILWFAVLGKEPVWIGVFMLPLALLGLAVIVDILLDAWRRRDGVQLLLGAWLLMALPTTAYEQMACKYLVAAAPAVALLVASLHARSNPPRRAMTWITVSAGIALSLLIISADARFAAVGKRAALEQIAPRVASGLRVWANGSWGFEWYALKAGAIPVSAQPPYPSPGDILISSSATVNISLERFPSRVFIAELRETSRLGRIMSASDGAGFYSNWWGYLPWTWRNGEIENLTIWKIQ